VCWSTEIPGEGHSSPIVARGSVFVTSALGDGRERALLRLDAATGKVLWSRVVVKSGDLEPLHHENAHASSTPAADHRVIYTSCYANGRTHLAATDYEGRALWAATPLRYRSEHGYHHNPLLLGDQLVLAYEQLAEAAVLSLDTATGRERCASPFPTTNARTSRLFRYGSPAAPWS
jgi:outer membrane protein assembly factor BamB